LGTGTQEAAAPAPARPAADELPAAGERVRSHRFSRQGTVVAVENGQVVVAFDSIRMTLEPADLERVAGVEVRAPAAAVEEAYRFEPRLDVRGMDRQDAEDAVRRFLDDALVAGVDELSIVHGYGTGALRRMLWERLRRDRRVENLAPAAPAEGGSGVTRVRLRESTA
ncbi:hypothetical protein FJY71_10310, partial [candidate division WOR-3 bacterium]|nr:hypothetical protein [candidate division WOR-3 bacterium]